MSVEKQKTGSFFIDPLSGEKNYEIWSIRLEAYLTKETLSNYICKKRAEFPENSFEEQNALKTASIIKLNLNDGPLLQIRHLHDPFDI